MGGPRFLIYVEIVAEVDIDLDTDADYIDYI